MAKGDHQVTAWFASGRISAGKGASWWVTRKRYEGTVVRHIKPYLEKKIIPQVTGKDVQKLYDTLTHHGNRDTGAGLFSGTI